MKKTIYLASFIFLLLINYGCPVGLEFPLGYTGKEKINNDLLGTWITDSTDSEVVSVTLEKNDNYSYKVTVNERGEMFSLETDNLTGWIAKLDGKEFLYVKPDNEEKYYHYMIVKLEDKTLISTDVALLDGGVDAVKSTESLRKQVLSSLKNEDFGNETITWKKQ